MPKNDVPTLALEGWTPIQKGWTPKAPNERPMVGSGGKAPPTGGSAIKQPPPPPKH